MLTKEDWDKANRRAANLDWKRHLKVTVLLDIYPFVLFPWALMLRFFMEMGLDVEHGAWVLLGWIERYEDLSNEWRELIDEADRKAGNPPIDWDKGREDE